MRWVLVLSVQPCITARGRALNRRVEVEFWHDDPLQELPEPGILTFIDRAVDSSMGTIMLKALFENSGRRLWPAEFVDVVLRLGERSQVIVVPEEAVQEGQEGSRVFVGDASARAELRRVSVGPRTNGHIVIELADDAFHGFLRLRSGPH